MTNKSEVNQYVDQLFRHESGKMVAVLTKILGTAHIDMAEDVVQDAIAEAINQWTYKGVPENPAGWIYNVARYKAFNIIKRKKVGQKYLEQLVQLIQSESALDPAADSFFSEEEIADDQLRMMFICCHPSISTDSQIALTLKTLCGFSIPEIAKAFLTNQENINKRLVRARQYIRQSGISFELPFDDHFESRLDSVLETIFLLFSEGYNASEGEDAIRLELCEEAIRLTQLIADHAKIHQKSQVWALLSLMLLNTSRFKSRGNENSEIVELANQKRELWNQAMIQKGIECLDKSIETNVISKYQILAAISAHHCTAATYGDTDWESILSLYDNLTQIDGSPIILLNKAVVVSKVHGAANAIAELEGLGNDPLLQKYPYYYSTLAELNMERGAYETALQFFEKSIAFSRNEKEISYMKNKIKYCKSAI